MRKMEFGIRFCSFGKSKFVHTGKNACNEITVSSHSPNSLHLMFVTIVCNLFKIVKKIIYKELTWFSNKSAENNWYK